MLTVVSSVGIFAMVLSMGATFLGMINPERRLYRPHSADHNHRPFRIEISIEEFHDLEIDGEPLPWPSAVTHEAKTFDPLPWPSTGWDDEHFGKTLTGDELQAAQAASRAAVVDKKVKTQKKQKKQSKKSNRNRVEERVRQGAQQVRERVQQGVRDQVGQVRAKVDERLGFSTEEVVAMVGERGLAGAVEHIRKSTGWDFKKAAQFVAQALRN